MEMLAQMVLVFPLVPVMRFMVKKFLLNNVLSAMETLQKALIIGQS